MTRFARAQGSKSSNERLPEEATSWQEMKQQLQKKQNSSKTKAIRQERPHFDFKTDETTEWAEFEKPVNLNKTKKEKKKKNNKHIYVEQDENKERKKKNKHIYVEQDEKKERKKKNKHISLEQDESNTEIMGSSIGTTNEDNLHKLSQHSTKVKKKSSKKLLKKIKANEEVSLPDIDATIGNESIKTNEKKKKKIKNITQDVSDNDKLKNKNKKRKQSIVENMTSDTENIKQRKFKKKKINNFQQEHIKGKNPDNYNNDYNKSHMKNNKFKTRKQKGQPYKRRKPETFSEKMFINGKEIEVTKFDGFPVKKEDAERLAELRKNMVARGIPKEEVSVTMKLERRKAEKALARERKKVCFHCRKSGHLLSECPELGDSNETATGICFKCGSTEHTHFECKVVRSQDFRYAECFICKEQGHIARQCPDNPRGLYPKGGACKVCGDVTHLKKDCPDLTAKKENETITLQTLDSNSLEVLDEDIKKTKYKSSDGKAVKKKSVVKF